MEDKKKSILLISLVGGAVVIVGAFAYWMANRRGAISSSFITEL